MMDGSMIYLDYNATTPLDQEVLQTMNPYFTSYFGNSGSDHPFGWQAKEAVEKARFEVGCLLGCKPTEVIFTSGATEAANMALLGINREPDHNKNHIITCRTEHKAVLEPIAHLENKGFKVSYLDVDREGNIDLGELKKLITSQTAMVSIMLANNETGLIHPIKEISEIVRDKGSILMSDITQAVGKIPVDIHGMGIDIAVCSAHKIYGPNGVGALILNKKSTIDIKPILYGGGQEKLLRPGSVNVAGIVGFGKAASLALQNLKSGKNQMSQLKNELEKELIKMEGVMINSENSTRLPNTTNITITNVDGTKLIRSLSNIALSRGSACTSNLLQPSHVLVAMGLSHELALSSLRISTGRGTTSKEIAQVVENIKQSVDQLRIHPS